MMDEMRTITGLIVDSNEERRIRLKGAAQLVTEFSKVTVAPTLRDANEYIATAQAPWDVVFLSNEMNEDAISRFIQSSKKSTAGCNSAYVLILNTEKRTSSDVFTHMRTGIDGLLYEPYSVEQLTDIIELSATVKQRTSEEKESAAVHILLQDLIGHLDRMVLLKKLGYDIEKGVRRFATLCHNLTTISAHEMESYHETAIKIFEEAPSPKTLENSLYKGPSQRVREQQERRLLQKMEGE